jgi:hypothetical protein
MKQQDTRRLDLSENWFFLMLFFKFSRLLPHQFQHKSCLVRKLDLNKASDLFKPIFIKKPL